MSRIALMSALSLLVVSAGIAQPIDLGIDPQFPTSDETITVKIEGQWKNSCLPAFPRLLADGPNAFVLQYREPEQVCLPVLTPWSTEFDLGKLARGAYRLEVEVVDRNGVTELGAIGFTVTGAGDRLVVRPSLVAVPGQNTIEIVREGIGACPAQGPCSEPRVRIGGIDSPKVTILSDNRISAEVPPSLGPGRYEVQVTLRNGTTVLRTPAALAIFASNAEVAPALFERVLFPLFFSGPGGFGSQWTTEASIFNSNSWGVNLFQRSVFPCPEGPQPCPPVFPAGVTVRLSASETRPSGVLLYVPQEAMDGLFFELRVRDLSRQAESAGTEIPVVREDDFRRDRIQLLDVPADPRFRKTLRVYDADSTDGGRVRVRVFDSKNTAILDQTLQLTTQTRCVTEPCVLDEPGFAAITNFLELSPGLTPSDRVRVELTPATPGLRIWGFISITNNDTQQVTLVSP